MFAVETEEHRAFVVTMFELQPNGVLFEFGTTGECARASGRAAFCKADAFGAALFGDSDPSVVVDHRAESGALAVDHVRGVELRDDVGLGSVEALDERVVGKEEMVFAVVDLCSAKLRNAALGVQMPRRQSQVSRPRSERPVRVVGVVIPGPLTAERGRIKLIGRVRRVDRLDRQRGLGVGLGEAHGFADSIAVSINANPRPAVSRPAHRLKVETAAVGGEEVVVVMQEGPVVAVDLDERSLRGIDVRLACVENLSALIRSIERLGAIDILRLVFVLTGGGDGDVVEAVALEDLRSLRRDVINQDRALVHDGIEGIVQAIDPQRPRIAQQEQVAFAIIIPKRTRVFEVAHDLFRKAHRLAPRTFRRSGLADKATVFRAPVEHVIRAAEEPHLAILRSSGTRLARESEVRVNATESRVDAPSVRPVNEIFRHQQRHAHEVMRGAGQIESVTCPEHARVIVIRPQNGIAISAVSLIAPSGLDGRIGGVKRDQRCEEQGG